MSLQISTQSVWVGMSVLARRLVPTQKPARLHSVWACAVNGDNRSRSKGRVSIFGKSSYRQSNRKC